jgi:hypothetical protein
MDPHLLILFFSLFLFLFFLFFFCINRETPSITKATCCLAINLCHASPERQRAMGTGIMTDLAESLEMFLPDTEALIFESPTHEVVCTWLLKFCACVSFEDTCAVDMIFLHISQYAIRGMKIACGNG